MWGLPLQEDFFTESFRTEETEAQVRHLKTNFLLILTPFPTNFA